MDRQGKGICIKKGCTIFLCLLYFAGPGFCRTATAGNWANLDEFSSFSSSKELFKVWKPLTFEKIENHTRYSLVKDNGVQVIKAESDNSASGLVRKISLDISKYRVFSWSWKITSTYEKGNVREKSGDDYPARIYITFAYDPEEVSFFEKVKFNAFKAIHGEYPPVAAINYIWANKEPEGTIVENPYTDRVRMIVIRSGDTMAGRWIKEERNLYKDFKKAFGGREPPRVSGIAVMTDSDNTGESGLSYYGDIRLKRADRD